MKLKFKHNKKYLFLLFPIISLPTLMLFSCENKQINNVQNYSDLEFENDFKKLVSSANFEDHFILLADNFLEKDKRDIFPTELKKQLSNLLLKAKNEDLNKKIKFKILDIILAANADEIGEAKIKISFENKNANKIFDHVFDLKGLKSLSKNSEGNFETNSNIDLNKYLHYSQEKRFLHDNNEYLKILRSYLASSMGIKNWNDLRKNVSINDSQIENFNKQAKKVHQDAYENLAYKGFTIPSYNSKNKIEGLQLFEGVEIGKLPSWVDSIGKSGDDVYKTIGLARKIVNQKYLDIAKQTFSINLSRKNDFKNEINQLKENIKFWSTPGTQEQFERLKSEKITKLEHIRAHTEKHWDEIIKNNKNDSSSSDLLVEKQKSLDDIDQRIKHFRELTIQAEIDILKQKIIELELIAKEGNSIISENGTMWILDYQLGADDYPTKWYFGTNSHVARALRDNLTSFSITKIANDVEVGQTLNLSRLDDNITTFYFNNKNAIKKVFDGVGYLKKKPSEFLIPEQRQKFQDYEAFADFAVLEIDFSKIKELSALSNEKNTTEKYNKVNGNDFSKNLAKEITNDYANQKDKHIKFRKNSYLKDYKNINYSLQGNNPKDLEYLYAVGWPRSTGDFYLDKKAQGYDYEWAKQNLSLWFNTDFSYYNKEIQRQKFDLNNKIDQGNFLSYNVGYRSFINKPGIVDTFISTPKFGDGFYELNGKKYINMTLGYVPRYYAPIAGASGSSIRNQNNELVSIYYSTNNGARAGLSAAFRSEGFDYQGLYGQYNLPQYDLIYGGGKDQKNSYREALKNLYPNLKTNLFQNGLEKIEDDYKFKEILNFKNI
ncbi:Ig-specific serine endopeptidase MIP [Metamycoplasma alkalescens]|uniref:Ig-specific serine endopeptidase MIP n=1 Tax=Metamycoplasma alkalescens TaxID=45363 RepID=UPI003D0481A9